MSALWEATHNFIALKKTQKQKYILAETNRGREIFLSNTGKNRYTFWVKRDTTLPLL